MNVIILSKEELSEIVTNSVRAALKSEKPTANIPPSQPEILTIEQTSKLLNLAKPTIYTLTSKCKIPHFKKGKKLYFKRSELMEWIEGGKQKTISDERKEMDDYLTKKTNKQ